jgi:hypothetical protein
MIALVGRGFSFQQLISLAYHFAKDIQTAGVEAFEATSA